MSRPTRNAMIRQLQKAFRAGSRLKPLHCGKSCRGAVPIRNPTSGVQSYAQKERECNCLRGQVNGHKATLYFTLSTTYLGHLSSLTNFAEFLAFRALSSPVLCRVPLLRVILQAATASVSKLKDLSEALQLEHGRNFAVFFLALQGRNPAEIRWV